MVVLVVPGATFGSAGIQLLPFRPGRSCAMDAVARTAVGICGPLSWRIGSYLSNSRPLVLDIRHYSHSVYIL